MYAEDQLLPISALQHLLFCPRQCALIHVEREWAENRYTVEGSHLHEKAHTGGDEHRLNIRIARGLRIRSFSLGLSGQADIVEFEGKRGEETERITLVEYKRGRPKGNDSDRVQLCAQGMCFEEMLSVSIGSGAIYYGARRRRTEVVFDCDLRERVRAAAVELHEMIDSQRTPPAQRSKKCDFCSLFSKCQPDVTHGRKSASRYVDNTLNLILHDDVTDTDLPLW